jgi:hypothetical protein
MSDQISLLKMLRKTTHLVGIHYTTYELLMVIVLVGVPNSKSDRDIFGQPFMVNAPMPSLPVIVRLS